MSRPVARYRPSRRYILFAILALCGTIFSAWTALRWPSTWLAAGLFGATSAALLALLWQPIVEIHETHLLIGKRVILWRDIRRLDQTGWIAPLAVRLTLSNERHVIVLYAGDLDSSTSLLRHLRRYSRSALLDGIPYKQAWGELEPGKTPELAGPPAPPNRQSQPAVHRPLLRPEEEEEIEKMFQRLKSVGRLDQRDQRDQRGSDE